MANIGLIGIFLLLAANLYYIWVAKVLISTQEVLKSVTTLIIMFVVQEFLTLFKENVVLWITGILILLVAAFVTVVTACIAVATPSIF